MSERACVRVFAVGPMGLDLDAMLFALLLLYLPYLTYLPALPSIYLGLLCPIRPSTYTG